MKIRFFFYHGLWHLTLFLARLFKNHLPPKLKSYLEEREIPQLVWRKPPLPGQRRLWFHAASGEIEYIRPLLRLWKQKHPEDVLFLTYFSTSARSMIKSLDEIDGWAPLPFDLPGPCEAFLRHLKPDLLVIARTDLWPTLLAKASGISKILVASTWSEGSKKAVGAGRWMSRWCLPYLNKICVVSKSDAEVLKKIGASLPLKESKPIVSITGDPRFDQVQFRLQQGRRLPELLLTWTSQHSLFIAGSTWPEDEVVLLESWKLATPTGQRFLLVPHESSTEHLKALMQQFSSRNLDFALWSQCQEKGLIPEVAVLIFDQKGWLAELYQIASIAFIGGSFKKQVHSVMEALGCGLPVLVGPHYLNNREAIEFAALESEGTHFVTAVTDRESLTQELKKHWQRSDLSCKRLQSEIRNAFLNRCKATEKTFEEIQACL